MGKKLYVGNLPFSINDQSLQDLFTPVGQVESAKVITDPSTGRSKGFGFVEMSTDDEAANAISTLNSKECDGRKITVSEARPKAPREGGFNRGGGGGGGYRGGQKGGGGYKPRY